MIRMLIADGDIRSEELAKSVNKRPAGSSTSATSTVVAASTPIRKSQGGCRSRRTVEPLMWARCQARPSGSCVQMKGTAARPTMPAMKSHRQCGASSG